MNGLLSELSSLLVAVVMLLVAMAVVPYLLKLLVPVLGEPLWRGYWRAVRWVLLAPMRLLAYVVRQSGRRGEPNARPSGAAGGREAPAAMVVRAGAAGRRGEPGRAAPGGGRRPPPPPPRG